MDRENTSPVQNGAQKEGDFAGEGNDENRSSSGKDLAAAAGIAVFALLATLIAFRMPNPGTPLTAPGLLPLFTGIALFVMAVGLGIKAVRSGGSKDLLQGLRKGVRNSFADLESHRALMLIGIIILYVILVNLIAFDLRLPTGFFVFRFSSYELISIITLTLILRIFWRATTLRCFLVSVFWIVALASVFRYAFHILLPGLG